MSTSKGRASKTSLITSNFGDSKIEVGSNNNGLGVGITQNNKGNNSIWVIIDRLTKSAHFLLIRVTYTLDKLAEVYVFEIVHLHRSPKSIISD